MNLSTHSTPAQPAGALQRLRQAASLLLATAMLTAGVLKAQGCQSAPPAAPEAQAPVQRVEGDEDTSAPAAATTTLAEELAQDMPPDQDEPALFPATKSGMPIKRKFMPATKSAAPMPGEESPLQPPQSQQAAPQ